MLEWNGVYTSRFLFFCASLLLHWEKRKFNGKRKTNITTSWWCFLKIANIKTSVARESSSKEKTTKKSFFLLKNLENLDLETVEWYWINIFELGNWKIWTFSTRKRSPVPFFFFTSYRIGIIGRLIFASRSASGRRYQKRLKNKYFSHRYHVHVRDIPHSLFLYLLLQMMLCFRI